MKLFLLCTLVVGALSANLPGSKPRAALDESFGYVEVRTGAHMFWVTYETDGPGLTYLTAPLIMWLQGGPGASGVGYGNFAELGPRDINGNLRSGRWTQKANVMFVDNPIGAGYSYTDNNDISLLPTTNQQIADDLVALVKSVFITMPEYQTMPFFVYCESYGGKMTADFALTLNAAINNGDIAANFQGVGLGDSWISPMDSVNTWGSFLYSMGFVNAHEQETIDNSANRVQTSVDAGDWEQATTRWSATEVTVLQVTDGVDFYNVLAEEDVYVKEANGLSPGYLSPAVRKLANLHGTKDALDDYMNSEAMKNRWLIPDNVTWGGQSNDCFNQLSGDFMKPVITSVAQLIDTTDLHVAVYTGDLDLICDTPGTYRWIENMDWADKALWEAEPRQNFHVNSYSYRNAGYSQRYNRFSLHSFLDAGHMVPLDAPEASFILIDQVSGWAAEAQLKKKIAKKSAADHQEEVDFETLLEEVAEHKHVKQIEEPPRHMNPKRAQHLEDIKEKIKNKKAEVSAKNSKEAEFKARVAAGFKNRATPEGRKMHKDRHIDPRKPIFHQ